MCREPPSGSTRYAPNNGVALLQLDDDAVLQGLNEYRRVIVLRSPVGVEVQLLAAQHPVEREMIALAERTERFGPDVPIAPLGGVLLVKAMAGRLLDIAALEQTAEHLPFADMVAALKWAEARDPVAGAALRFFMERARARKVPSRQYPVPRPRGPKK